MVVGGGAGYSHLLADPLGEGGAQVRLGGARLHGDQLHLVVVLTPRPVRRAARQTVHVIEDGGRGQQLVWSAAWGTKTL